MEELVRPFFPAKASLISLNNWIPHLTGVDLDSGIDEGCDAVPLDNQGIFGRSNHTAC